jgi:hydrogenase maturation factor HypF (carbamoyltransferase family)
MNSWKQLDKNRVYKNHPAGFLIIKPKTCVGTTPFLCPVCDLFMRNNEDVVYHAIYKCCSHCATRWAEGSNREKWLQGWRPTEDELKEYR